MRSLNNLPLTAKLLLLHAALLLVMSAAGAATIPSLHLTPLASKTALLLEPWIRRAPGSQRAYRSPGRCRGPHPRSPWAVIPTGGSSEHVETDDRASGATSARAACARLSTGAR